MAHTMSAAASAASRRCCRPSPAVVVVRRVASVTVAAAPASAPPPSPVIHDSVASIRDARRRSWGIDSKTTLVGFVPTMGALHEGHLSLVRAARSECDVVICSIFVNPAQFRKGEELEQYPRDLGRDAELLSTVGVDHIFAPSPDDIYGNGHVTFVDPMGFDATREGRSRPGHFRGVATVVTKLLNIIRPTHAYFGQKDAAQCALVRRIVLDLNLDLEVRITDTVRESDGLALSTRNAYLNSEEREAAPVVYRSLCAAREFYESRCASGRTEVPSEELVEAVISVLKTEDRVVNVHYVSVDDREGMRPLDCVGEDGAIISVACVVGSVRLIDNFVLRGNV